MSSRQATVTIDLDAIQHNFNYARAQTPSSRIMAIVKADAYGHGAIQVARKLRDADALGLARVSEAVKLREAGIQTPICLLEGAADKEELNLASVYELQLVVHSQHQADLLKKHGARRPVWLKIDTGMGRLGVQPDDAAALLNELKQQNLLQIIGRRWITQCSDQAINVSLTHRPQ